ncbi:hypothetical protein [Kitasatospora griseola]|uniref:hypothetical protein n=1 Tax=Kitasatospora griseola TaxID=2064 RepID=UPI00364E588B
MSATDPFTGPEERPGNFTISLTPLTDQQQAARRTIATQARDTDDEQLLLEALGLDTTQEHR